MAMEVKICGLTRLEDAQAAQDAGADFLGFVLYARSLRGITARTLRRITAKLIDPPPLVGVFVNARRQRILQIAADCGLHAIQLHGDEAPTDFQAWPGPLWRALSFRRRQPYPAPQSWPAERYILDAAAPGQYGGSGRRVDWQLAAALARKHPLMLAGGLTPENVAQAVRRVRPQGVDVASGVEKAPGKKDPRKLVAFIQAVRSCRIPPR
ncbi:MAG: phosphoribosylanthranilate isomerase [Lentisphaerae bacterium]|nr:phosphoribosylanthranilate isomerase [Lentisphaerota bacterium]